ncbi:MAG TPA: HDOD domain-containing protein, partial [Pyrinomonadaceae bacterium]|nr:HDOD domain-containing protein [Pyrinomonadaceae bacterium]
MFFRKSVAPLPDEAVATDLSTDADQETILTAAEPTPVSFADLNEEEADQAAYVDPFVGAEVEARKAQVAQTPDLSEQTAEPLGGELETPTEEVPTAPLPPRRPIIKASIDIDTLVEMELPPLPGSALRVALLSMDMGVSTNAVAEAIGCDPILTTRILRAANSPIYAVERKFT